MLYYNIDLNQVGRSTSFASAATRTLCVAVAASLGLHALVIAAMLTDLSAYRLAVDAGAAIAVYVEPGAGPAATAHESTPSAAPASESSPPEPPAPEAEAMSAIDPPKEVSLPDFEPPPPEVLAPPEFSQPTPPLPKPVPTVAQPARPQAVPKPEPKRPAPAVASSAPASPGLSPTGAASSVPAPAPMVGSPATVAPGWNALLAAWLAANRRYPDEARRRSEEGEVTIRFTVAADGRVSEVAIVKGSGSAALDAAALRMMQGATLPAPGVEAARTVRIRYRLRE